MDKLELFNALIAVVTPVNSMGAHAASLDDSLIGTGLDSLDLLMMGIYLGDIYGVAEEELKLLQPTTVKDMFDFMEQRKTKEIPQTVQEALGMVL
jgi:acyl carrier protein